MSAANPPPTPGPAALERALRLPGAIVTGLGSILGTGVFVGLAIATGVAGAAVIPAVALAALLATANGLSSARLAAAHPVAGGTYAYGRRYLHPTAGFAAGWLFLLAKSASAATAALGLAGYLLDALGAEPGAAIVPVALGAVALVVLLVLAGVRRTSAANALLLVLSIGALVLFVVVALPAGRVEGATRLAAAWPPESPAALAHATALVFVAYTGYGRIATLGEEVIEPARTIPRAVIATLAVSALLYLLVATAAIAAVGAPAFAAAADQGTAPLESIARAIGHPRVAGIVAVGAIAAMAGVLLNLLLGLSRVAFAMGRDGELPRGLGRLAGARRSTPIAATLFVGTAIAALVLVGDVRATWSFSAFTVLAYYALTNLAALRLPRTAGGRRLVPAIGLAGCLGLAFFVDPRAWALGLGLLVLGLLLRSARARLGPADQPPV